MSQPPDTAPFSKVVREPARKPGFMGGGPVGEAVRAVFPSVPVGEAKTLRALMVRSVVKRSALQPAVERLHQPPIPSEEPPSAAAAIEDAPVEEPAAEPPPAELGPPIPAEFASPSSLAPPPPQAAIDYAERLAAGVSALRLTSERLAEQARTDALELALLVARRIVEAELTTNVEHFFGVIKSIIRRAGETQRVVIRLHPEDAERVEAAGGARAVAAAGVAHVEVASDPDLQLGDCMVDADFGLIDGRLSTRLDEMRRLLIEAMAAEEP